MTESGKEGLIRLMRASMLICGGLMTMAWAGSAAAQTTSAAQGTTSRTAPPVEVATPSGEERMELAQVPGTEEIPADHPAVEPARVAPAVSPWGDRGQLMAEIDALEKEKDDTAGLGGPITTMAIGGGALIYGLTFLYVFGSQQSLNSSLYEDDYYYAPDYTPWIVAGGIGAGVGVVMLSVGGIWLGSRIKKRRGLSNEIEERERQLEFARVSFDLVPIVSSTSAGLGLQGSF